MCTVYEVWYKAKDSEKWETCDEIFRTNANNEADAIEFAKEMVTLRMIAYWESWSRYFPLHTIDGYKWKATRVHY